jgi:predicted PurR-regulated permease PerM
MALNPSSQPYQWTFRRVMWTTFVFVLVLFSFYLLYRFYQVVFLVVIALLLGTVIRPVVTWLNRRGVPRVAGVIVVFLLLLALLISFVLLLFPLIVEQGTTIAAAVPGYYQNLREWMVNNPIQLVDYLGDFLPVTMPVLASTQQTGQQVLVFAGQAMGIIASTANAIFISTAMMLLVFHWTLDGPRIIHTWLMLVPREQRDGIDELISAMSTKVVYYIAGQGVLCLVIGSLALVAYLIIGLPNALVLALIAGIMEAVPMVGPLLGAIPAGAIALTISPIKLVWLIVATIVIQQLENIILVPRVMRKAVGVNPFVSILAIFSFSSLFGIAGALMAIPIAAILQLLLNRFVFHPTAMVPETSSDRDLTSRLRYEAQDLALDLRKQARLNKDGSDLQITQIDHVMDEIEAITTDLDALLAQTQTTGLP